MPTPLPVLNSVAIATPCPASWDDMEGDGRVRFCSQCQQSVYNVAELSRSEATALIDRNSGQLCLRLFRRADGTVMTRDCPVGVWRAARRKLAAVVGVWVFLVLLSFAWFTGRAGAVRVARQHVQTVKNWIDPRPPCVTGEMIPQTGVVPAPPPAKGKGE